MATTVPPQQESTNSHSTARKGPKKAQRKWLWPTVFVLILIAAFVLYRRANSGSANAGIITAAVVRGDITETVTGTGSIEAQTGAQVHIGSQITGVIKRLYADVGTKVKKGQLIAQLDLPDLQDTYLGAVATAQGAATKYQQEISGVQQERVTTVEAINQAKATLANSQQALVAAEAAASEQKVATPTDIRKAQTALDTANATYVQTQAGANLQIATAKEQLVQAQANAKNSSANLTRNHDLYLQGFIAATAYDQAVTTDNVNQSLVGAGQENLTLTQQKVTADLETSKQAVVQAQAALDAAKAETLTTAQRIANVKAAQASVNVAQAALQTALINKANDVLKDQDVRQAEDAATTAAKVADYDKAQVDKSEIRSPIDGTVLQLNVQQGETVAAGLSAPTVITVADLDRLEVEDYVSEEDIGKVKIGQKATVVVDSFPSTPFSGAVQKIYAGSTIQQNVVTYDVVVSISDPTHRLRPDMTSTVNIIVGQRSNVLMVPSVAIQLGTNGSTVNVMKTVDGKLQMVAVPVKTGGTDGVNVEILSGLNEGDTVVLAGGASSASKRGPANPFSSGGKGGGSGGK